MTKIKEYLEKIIKILSLKELRILPAYLSYGFVLASVPMVTIIVIVAGMFSISVDTIINFIEGVLPSYASSIITSAISGRNFDLTVGALNLFTILIAAKGMYAIINASNSLYKVEKTKTASDYLRAILILLIIICSLLFLIVVPLLGGKILSLLGNLANLENIINDITIIYQAIRWPITFLILFINIKIIYIIAPSVKVKSSDTTIGAFVTTLGWMLFTFVFGYYIKYFGNYDIVYGGLSSITIFLIWIYVLSYILILGIVINTRVHNKK